MYLDTFYSMLCYVIPSHVCLNMGLSKEKKSQKGIEIFLSLSLELKTNQPLNGGQYLWFIVWKTLSFKRLSTSTVSAPGFLT